MAVTTKKIGKEITIPVPWGHIAGQFKFFFIMSISKLTLYKQYNAILPSFF